MATAYKGHYLGFKNTDHYMNYRKSNVWPEFPCKMFK